MGAQHITHFVQDIKNIRTNLSNMIRVHNKGLRNICMLLSKY